MEKNKYEFVNKALYFSEEKILVFGDLHIGYEDELKLFGITIPTRQTNEILKEITEISKKIKDVKKIIFLGDVRHSFGKILFQEKKDLNLLFDLLNKKFPGKKIIITKGNHDTMLKKIYEKEKWKNVEIVDYYLEKEYLFYHGDFASMDKIKKIEKKAKYHILGHFHPAIDLSDGEREERFKCFLNLKKENKEILIVPSFFPLVDGPNVLDHPQLTLDFVEQCDVFIIAPDGEVMDFGRVRDLMGK